MRTINWRHFAPAECESCQHPENIKAGGLCSEHGAMAESFLDGFEAAARLAVYATWSSAGFVALGPSGLILRTEGWGPLMVKRRGEAQSYGAPLYFPTRDAAQAAANSLPWWPLQPWEVEA